LLEDFLLARVRVSGPDPLIAAAVAWFEQGSEAKRIDDLTRYIGLSQSALERRFRRKARLAGQRAASLLPPMRGLSLHCSFSRRAI
jgi:transcriptional regulator GlxA family with amidase domain